MAGADCQERSLVHSFCIYIFRLALILAVRHCVSMSPFTHIFLLHFQAYV